MRTSSVECAVFAPPSAASGVCLLQPATKSSAQLPIPSQPIRIADRAVYPPLRPMLHRKQAWLFGPATDIGVFAGSALGSVLFLALTRALGFEGETPVWAFLLLVVAIDVSHVWATLYRVYFDG